MENERHIKVEEIAVETEGTIISKEEYDKLKFYKEDRKKLYEENHELKKQLEEVQKENEELKNGIINYVRKLGE